MISFQVFFTYADKEYKAVIIKISDGVPVSFEVDYIQPADFDLPDIFAFSTWHTNEKVTFPVDVEKYPLEFCNTLWNAIVVKCGETGIAIFQ